MGSPLMFPWFAQANYFGAFILMVWIILPSLYYTNTWWGQYMPLYSSSLFDNTGAPYNVTRIVNSDYSFNLTAFKQYSPIMLPPSYALTYAISFGGIVSLITHVFLYYRHQIVRQWKSSLSEIDDIHFKLMQRYKEVPHWWYAATFIVCLTASIFTLEYYHTQMRWYGLTVIIIIAGVMFVPVGIITAITNTTPSIFLVCQIIAGYMFPGHPVANNLMVTYGYISTTQGMTFAGDLKLGHYMKIPPRTMFTVQFIGTIIGAFVQIGVLNWLFHNIDGMCTLTAEDGFTCPYAKIHFNGSIIWYIHLIH
ncbi:Glutathione transporter 1 [Neolecta irregularis DAH-3]|uniref:Glutathione transporter 1 n=1 Tax=Neolecta irregularis (strain DAH-3) TaxID=1198029 RepID=A0A1U7LHA6_NEOID|nr:Glutathione transporter 1 [Neolecta irregularis DAH-3]|eukprot:OLL22029.1 Glutathione transporter 1 [Neolecta irregularis DAH-3]